MPEFLPGLIAFAAYFAGAAGFCVVYAAVYTRLTRHDEFDLIVKQGNASAAVAFGGSLLGFAIALAGAIHHTGSIAEFAIWASIALVAQLAAYFLARLSHPGLSRAIEEDRVSAAIWLAAVSVSAGLISAACMTP